MRTFLLLFTLAGQLVLTSGAASPMVTKALGGDSEELGASERFAALTQLGDQLRHEDREAIFHYLTSTAEPPPVFTEAQWYAYFNDLIALLVKQRSTGEEQVPIFLQRLFKDRQRPVVLRDYALQHLADWIRRHGDHENQSGISTLYEAAAELEATYSGTALLALRRVREKRPESVADGRLGELAMNVLRSAESPAGTRATALAVALDSIKRTEALELARPWALDPTQPLPVRLNVISALGHSGDTVTLEKLKQQETENRWIQDAVTKAIARQKDAQ